MPFESVAAVRHRLPKGGIMKPNRFLPMAVVMLLVGLAASGFFLLRNL